MNTSDTPNKALEAIADGKRLRQRLAVCKQCPFWHGSCDYHDGCCFGRWARDPASKCPENRWPEVQDSGRT